MGVWIAMRTPGREKLGTTPPIRRRRIVIAPVDRVIAIERRLITEAGNERVAREDGFSNAEALFEWMLDTHGRLVEGYVFRW